MTIPVFLQFFDLDATAEKADIKRAYARQLKQIDRAKTPEAFETLRAHYEAALSWAEHSLPDAYEPDLLANHLELPRAHVPIAEVQAKERSPEPQEDVPVLGHYPPAQVESIGSRPEPELALAQEDGSAWMREFESLVLHLFAPAPDEIEFALKEFMVRFDQQSLVFREQFDHLLMDAIAQGRWNRQSAPILFAWRKLRDFNYQEERLWWQQRMPYINVILTEYDALEPGEQQTLWYVGKLKEIDPVLRTSRSLHGLINKAPAVLKFVCGEERTKQWLDLCDGVVLRPKPTSSPSSDSSSGFPNWYILMGLISAIHLLRTCGDVVPK